MLVRLRLSVPDRPGSLGQVASAFGSAGADIARVEVLHSEGGRALDDVFVQLRDVAHLERLVDRLGAVNGIRVEGVQHPAPPTSGHAELELVNHLVTRPDTALQTLVDGIGHAIGADWAALLDFGTDGAAGTAIARSPSSPPAEVIRVSAARRLTTIRLPRHGDDRTPYGGAALAPLAATSIALLVVREEGPTFHRSELWRLGQIGEIAGTLMKGS